MRGRFKRKNQDETAAGAAHRGAEPGAPAADSEEASGPGIPGRKKGAKRPVYDSDKVYLGVRVKMPVRDLLKNIRVSQGGPPLEAQRKDASPSLEELAIIVEVLEEDLRTGSGGGGSSWSSSRPPQSPNWSPGDVDEIIPSPDYQQVLSPPEWASSGLQLQKEEHVLGGMADAMLLHTDGRGRTSLHQVACIGKRALGYCIAKRMAALNSLDLRDSSGMTALLYAAMHNHHLMVADLIHLGANVNARNNSGKSCLHLSAERGFVRVLEAMMSHRNLSFPFPRCRNVQGNAVLRNHAANNQSNITTELSYLVLKQAMVDGVYVDVEAADNAGMSVLQCASVAMKAAVRDLEQGRCSRLSDLRQEQMMETLECLLQMASYLHTMTMRPAIG